MNRQVLTDVGLECHAVGAARDDARDDAAAFDVESLRRHRLIGTTEAAIEVQAIDARVRPVLDHEENDQQLGEDERFGDPAVPGRRRECRGRGSFHYTARQVCIVRRHLPAPLPIVRQINARNTPDAFR